MEAKTLHGQSFLMISILRLSSKCLQAKKHYVLLNLLISWLGEYFKAHCIILYPPYFSAIVKQSGYKFEVETRVEIPALAHTAFLRVVVVYCFLEPAII